MTFVLLFLPYPVTDAVRSLLSGWHPDTLGAAVAWCVAVLLAGRVWAWLAWRRGR